MKALSEFLKQHAEKHQGKKEEFDRLREEWVQSIQRLMNQLQTWLREADPEHLLEAKQHFVEYNEEAIGHYTVPSLVIYLEGRRVQVVPQGRRVVGGILQVGNEFAGPSAAKVNDLRKQLGDSTLPPKQDNCRLWPVEGLVYITDGSERYRLYRMMDGQNEKWLIENEGGTRMTPLDRQTFEEAIVSLLE